MQMRLLVNFLLLLAITTFPTNACKTVEERNTAEKMVINHDDSSNLINFHGLSAELMVCLFAALVVLCFCAVVLCCTNELKKMVKRRRDNNQTTLSAPQQAIQLLPYPLPPSYPTQAGPQLPALRLTPVPCPDLLSKMPNLSQTEV